MERGSMKFAVAVLWFSLVLGKATVQGKNRETQRLWAVEAVPLTNSILFNNG